MQVEDLVVGKKYYIQREDEPAYVAEFRGLDREKGPWFKVEGEHPFLTSPYIGEDYADFDLQGLAGFVDAEYVTELKND